MKQDSKMIRAIIIDDELPTRRLLGGMLRAYCPSVEVTCTASSAEEGYRLIRDTRPELVFLDIKMRDKTGFDMLRMFETITFNVIFVSAFDEYAIESFEFNAVDYILKPIDHTRLIKAVCRAEYRIREKDYSNVVHFVQFINEKKQAEKRIPLHYNDKVHLVDTHDICYVHALEGYSEIVTENNQRFISTKTLSEYESLLKPFDSFVRANKSMIINIRHIQEYTKGMTCMVTIRNSSLEIEVSRRKKGSIIQYLKHKM